MDSASLHQNMAVAFGTSFQHFPDILFIQMFNFVLLQRDVYLDHTKPCIKFDKSNKLRNTSLFDYSLFSILSPMPDREGDYKI